MTVFWLDREQVLDELETAADRLLDERPEVLEVVLFGSIAEERAVPGSDADVLLILAEEQLEAARARREGTGGESNPPGGDRWIDRPLAYGPYFDEAGAPVELFCYTREEAEGNKIAKRALDGGLVLAGRCDA